MTSIQNPRPDGPTSVTEDGIHTHLKYTVLPDTETLVRVKTLPDALCRVRFDAADSQPFTVVASSAGYVDLYATATQENEPRRIIVEATSTSGTAEHAIDLRCAAHPTPDAPNHVPDPWPASPHDQILPALGDEEAADEDAAKLAARGYPRRPDPDSGPANYEQWRRFVSRPLTMVAPSVVPNPDFRRQSRVAAARPGTETITPAAIQGSNSLNWAGAELAFIEGDTFVLVEGWWTTPAVTLNFLPDGYGSTVIWVGLTPPNTPQLLQCGVYHNAIATFGTLVASYQAFSEMLPAEPFSMMINNFNIAPGDQMMCTSAVTNNANLPSLHATKAQNHVSNLATQKIAVVNPPLDPTMTNGAADAVWIAERPTLQNGSYPLLAQFPEIKFTSAAAEPGRQTMPMVPCYTPNSPDLTATWDFMYNTGGTLLASGLEPGPSAPYEVDVIWTALA